MLLIALLGLNSRSAPGADVLSDNFGQAARVYGVVTLVGSNVNATAEPGEPAHFAEPARHSLWAKWTPTVTATYSLTTSNSPFDTVLAVYLGTALNNLKVVATNDDIDFRTLSSWVTFRAYPGETFHIAVDGAGGATGRVELRVIQGGAPMASWTTTTAMGVPVSSEDFTAPVLLLDFWETTCGACVAEIYQLFQLQRTLSPKGFSLVGLAIDKNEQDVQNFLLEYPPVYPQILSSPSALVSLNEGQPIGPPTKYLVDQDRRIVARFMGGVFPVSDTASYYAAAAGLLLRTTSVPELQIQRQGGAVRVSWSDGVVPAGFQLQAAADPAPAPGGWSNVSGPTETNHNRISMTLPADVAGRFFRLSHP